VTVHCIALAVVVATTLGGAVGLVTPTQAQAQQTEEQVILQHVCMAPSDREQRAFWRENCDLLAEEAGFEQGVFRPLTPDQDGFGFVCAQDPDQKTATKPHVCVGSHPIE